MCDKMWVLVIFWETKQGLNLRRGVEREGRGEFWAREDSTADLVPGFANARRRCEG